MDKAMLSPIRLAAIPIGYAVEWYGKRSNRIAVQWLGHYMTCNGKKMYLPDKIVSDYLKSLYYYEPRRSYRVWHTICDDNMGTETRRLYNTVGKCRLWNSQDKGIHILDRYVFYPTCAYSDCHGPNCGCADTDRSWKQISFHWRIPLSTKVKFHVTKQKANWFEFGAHKWAEDRLIGVVIGIYDRLFTFLGKPFYTVWHSKP